MTTGYATPATEWTPPVAPRRSGWVTTAAVVLLTIGTLSALMGLLFVVMAVAFGPTVWTDMLSGQPDMEGVNLDAMGGFMTGVFIGFGIVALIWAGAHVAAGIGVLSGRGWARITGIVLSILGLVFTILGVVATVASIGTASRLADDPEFREQFGSYYATGDMMGASIVMSLLFLLPFAVGYVIALVALIRNGAYFDRRPATVAAPPTTPPLA